jgi:hypothetical protein
MMIGVVALSIIKYTALFEVALTFIHYVATPNAWASNPPCNSTDASTLIILTLILDLSVIAGEYSMAIILTLMGLTLPIFANIWGTWIMVKRFQTHYVSPSVLVIMYMVCGFRHISFSVNVTFIYR